MLPTYMLWRVHSDICYEQGQTFVDNLIITVRSGMSVMMVLLTQSDTSCFKGKVETVVYHSTVTNSLLEVPRQEEMVVEEGTFI